MLNRKLAASLVLITLPGLAMASEDPAKACTEAAKLYEQQDIEGALEEARWCVEALEQIKQQQATDVFPDSVVGFTGGEITRQKMMGFSIIERTYTKDGKSISVTLNESSDGGMGGLAALAQMGGMGGNKIRVQRRTVSDMSEGGHAQFIVSLKSGGMLNFDSSNVGRDATLAFVEEFPIAKLDEAL